MLVRNRILALLVVLLILGACTATQARPIGWTFYWTYTNYEVTDFVIDWNWNPILSVSGFRFQIQSDPVLVGPFTIADPFAPFMLSPVVDLGAGLYEVTGSAPAGTLPPTGDVNLADFTFSKPFPEGAPFTMSLGPNGYFVMVDPATGLQTMLGPGDVDPLTIYAPAVPEPSSIIALVGGLGSLFVCRRRRT